MKLECDRCILKKSDCCLPGEGPKDADIMIIGQSPGFQEQQKERVFIGPSGQELDESLHLAGLKREDIYITNAVKGLVPVGKTISKTLSRICIKQYLLQEIEEVKPKVIIATGAVACRVFDTRFITPSNFYSPEFKCYVVITHHPTRVLKSYSDKLHNEFKEAFVIAKGLLTKTHEESPESAQFFAHISKTELDKLGDTAALDLETTGLNFMVNKILTVGLSNGDSTIGFPFEDNKKVFKEWVKNKKLILHNAKFDYKFLKKSGIDIQVAFDTMLAHFLIDRESPHALKEISLKYLHTKLTKGTIDFDNPEELKDLEKLSKYAANDAYMCFKLYKIFKEKIDIDYSKVFYTIMMPTLEWLANAEFRGVKIDREYVQKYINQLKYDLKALESDIVNNQVTKDYCTKSNLEELNIRSPKQLKDFIYTYLNLKHRSNNTAEKTLAELSQKYPKYEFLKKIVVYRSTYKIYKTYLKNLMEFSQYDERVHCVYNQARVPTGRLACSEPNLQNIPKGGPLAHIVRKAFVAAEGYSLIEADFKAAEFRALANYSKDVNMIGLIDAGKDIHRLIGSITYLKKEEEITDEERTKIKTVVFGIMYGRGSRSIAEAFKISIQEADDIKNNFFNTFKDATRWIKSVQNFAKKNGYVKTITGRKIALPQVYSKDEEIKSHAIRCSVNYPIQGVVGDFTNLAGSLVYREIQEKKLDAYVIMNIHDSIIVECKNEIKEEIKQIMQEAMTVKIKELMNFKVKLEIDIKEGKNLAFDDK